MEWDMKKAKCEGFEALLEDAVERVLSSEDAERLALHLRGCASCREALEEGRASKRLLQWGEPAAKASAGFARAVMARVREAQSRAGHEAGLMQALVTFASRLAITATLALGVLVAYTAVAPPTETRQLATMSAEDRSGLFTDPAQQVATRDGFLRTVVETSYGQK
jgi:hypothetical protein